MSWLRSSGLRRAAIAAVLLTCVVGTADRAAAQRAKKGQLVIVSGNGNITSRLRGTAAGDEFGRSLSADVVPMTFRAGCVIGGPGALGSAGRMAAYDCFTNTHPIAGRRLFTVDGDELAGGPVERFGEAIINLGHVDNADAVHWGVGAPGRGLADGPPSAVIVLHEEGGVLVERFRLEGDTEARLGWQLRPLEIVDGTSFFNTFAASAPGQRNGSRRAAGALHRFDTRTGERLWTLLGRKSRGHFGYSVSFAFDQNGDNFIDLVVGAPGRADRKKSGQVFIVSGHSGRVLRRIKAPRGAALFGFSTGSGDVDGDGVADFLVGAPLTDTEAGKDTGAVFAYSGVDRSLLMRWDGEAEGQWLGLAVAGMEDLDGDGRAEVAATSLILDENPRRDRRGGLDFFSPGAGEVLMSRRGKRANERFGWPIITCSDTCLVGIPNSADFYMPE